MKRIRAGRYEYKGYIVLCHGYYAPEHCVWWEAYRKSDKATEGEYHAKTKRHIKKLIDEDNP